MILKIGDIDISSAAIAVNIDEIARAENTQYSLTGKGYVDRFGGFRYRLNITLGLITCSRWETIKTALKELPVSVKFSVGGVTKTKNFHVENELPQPFIFNDSGVDMTAGITFSLEEI